VRRVEEENDNYVILHGNFVHGIKRHTIPVSPPEGGGRMRMTHFWNSAGDGVTGKGKGGRGEGKGPAMRLIFAAKLGGG